MSINISIDEEKLKASVKLLSENYTIKIKDLDKHKKLKDAYKMIKNFSKMIESQIYSDDEYPQFKDEIYQKFIGLILKQYRPSELIPDTVGSFLFGCFQQTHGDIDAVCSPLCARSIKSNKLTHRKKCSNRIIIQYNDNLPIDYTFFSSTISNSRFTQLGRCDSDIAYIFVFLNFNGFTLDELSNFKRDGIEKAQVMVTRESKHHIVTKMCAVNKLPLISDLKNDDFKNSLINPEIDNSEDYQYLVYIGLTAVIIVIVGYIYSKR